MTIKFSKQNVVVVANQFNPTIATSSWLNRYGVILDAELKAEVSVFTPPMVRAVSNRFELLVLEDRAQLTPSPDEPDIAHCVERLSLFLNTLPHTPLIAVGMNFVWLIDPVGETLNGYTRRLFFKEQSPFANNFSSEDTLYGASFQRNYGRNGILKLVATPVSTGGPQGFMLELSFNYHFQVANQENVTDSALAAVAMWEEVREDSRIITNSFEAQ